MTDAAAGYSRTPVGKKLGFRPAIRVFVDGMPDAIRHRIVDDIGGTPDWLFMPDSGFEAAHLFVTERALLESRLRTLLALIARDGFFWVSWPKKAAKVPTDITEDIIRDVALPMGLVDVKVCAVDAIWSWLKLVIRKEKR